MIYGFATSSASGDAIQAGAPLEDVFVNGELVTTGATAVPIPANNLLLDVPSTLETDQVVIRLGAYLQGNPLTDGGQILRGVIYTAAGGLIAQSRSVTIDQDMPAQWIEVEFPDPIANFLPAGDYRFGIHAGVTDQGAEIFTGVGGNRTVYSGDLFTNGAPLTLTGGVDTAGPILVFLETLDPIVIPTNVTDDYLSSLPFDITQRVFGSSAPIPSTLTTAVAGWYGTTFDPTMGANAIVRSDGPLADLVGERIMVTNRAPVVDRRVAVYVHDERDFPDEDAGEALMLTRRAFEAIANHVLDDVTVDVVVLA